MFLLKHVASSVVTVELNFCFLRAKSPNVVLTRFSFLVFFVFSFFCLVSTVHIVSVLFCTKRKQGTMCCINTRCRNFIYRFFTGVLPVAHIALCFKIKGSVYKLNCPGRKLPVPFPFLIVIFYLYLTKLLMRFCSLRHYV